MPAMAKRTARGAVGALLAAVAFLAQGARASVYPISDTFPPRATIAFLRPVPVFSYADSPSWIGGLSKPYIRVEGVSTSGPDAQLQGSLRVVHGWSSSPPDEELAILDVKNTACEQSTQSLEMENSESILVDLEGLESKDVKVDIEVKETGWHVIFITNCGDAPFDFKGSISIRNPYGFLDAWSYGALPLNLVLCLAYFGLAAVFIGLTVRHREHVLWLQYAIIGVILMGLIERVTWFFTYVEMNISGGRSCCPVRSDVKFALALAVLKRASSALLLLAVCLGFGVVKPKLARPTTLRLAGLGVFYTLASLNLEFRRLADISEHGRQTEPLMLSALLVSLSDVVILFWIYFAISEILRELRERQQISKLGMYQSLARALSAWVLVWFLFSLVEVLVFKEKVDVSWRYWYFLVSFWDFFFLGILLQISVIWRPSPLTAQYAFSHQLPTTENLDEFDHVGLEMQLPETAAEFVIGEDDEDDEDDQDHVHDDDISLEEGRGGRGSKARAKPGVEGADNTGNLDKLALE